MVDIKLQQLLRELPDYKALIVIANGKQYGVAIEGAYINVEMAQFPSHYYGTLELRHGPIVLIDDSYLTFIFSKNKPGEYEIKLMKEIHNAGGKIAVIAAEQDKTDSDYIFSYDADADYRNYH